MSSWMTGALSLCLQAVQAVLAVQAGRADVSDLRGAWFAGPPHLRIVLEADPTQIATRVSMKSPDGTSAEGGAFSDQALQQALSTAKSIGRSLLK